MNKHLTFLGPIAVTVLLLHLTESMIITSVLAGPKKYKTVSFDFLPIPLSYSVPNKFQFAYRGHYTFARPHFDVNMAMPVTLPMNFIPPPPPQHEDEYHNEAPPHEGDEEATYTAEADGEHGEGPNIQDVPVDGVSEHPKNPENNKYEGYESNTPSSGSPESQAQRPYTGKAQVSSFIDNGQFVNAHDAVATRNVNSAATEAGDAAFGDELPPISPERRTLLKDGKTISLGYETKGDAPKTDPITVHNRNPDSLPWEMTDLTELQKYYTTFTFTDQFRDPRTYYEPRRKKLLLASLFG